MPHAAGPPSPLALARFLRGLTQAQLAELAGKSEETISRLEAGGTPQWRTAQAISRALDIDVSAIFPPNDDAPAGNRREVTTSAGCGDGHAP